MAAWICPACKRSVPGYVAKCHCGAARPAEGQAVSAGPAAPVSASAGSQARFKLDFPWPVWAALAVVFVAFVAGIVWLFVAPPPERLPPLLGVIDPTPPPTPKPRR